MLKIPDLTTAKNVGRVTSDNIANWAEEAEARAEERASLVECEAEQECLEIRRKAFDNILKSKQKLAEKTYTSEEIACLREMLKGKGWSDEQLDKEFSVYTIKEKGLSKEAQALNRATQDKAELALQVQQLTQQNQELQQQLQAAQAIALQQLQVQQLQQQNQQLQAALSQAAQVNAQQQLQIQQLQQQNQQLQDQNYYLEEQKIPAKDLYYPLQQKNEQLQQQNQQLQQQLQAALAELAKNK